jgi:alcohol dehydrogenase (cytochrome c)
MIRTRARQLLVALVLLAGGLAAAQGTDFQPVTDAMLLDPSPNDWINVRRTYDGWGYSPLNQINKQNAQRLQLVWSWSMGPGFSEPTPLVYRGVMYLPNPNAVVQALDAVTGDLLWEYKKEEPGRNGYGLMRNLAIYGDKIYVTTRDAHLVALDARTGKVAWDQKVADAALGFTYTTGPLVVRGKIVTSLNGCQRYKDEGDICFIAAHDAATGALAWKTSTVARPGEPGGDTWGSLPGNRRAGGDSWITGSYDAKTNLIYWSTSQAKPWAGFQRGDESGALLYTNSVLALDPDTGKIVWHRQLVPGDNHDMDETFENVLVDVAGQPSLFKIGKLGILWQIDRRKGEVLAAHDLGYQNLYDVDARTGRLTLRPGMRPAPGVPIQMCPTLSGFKSWRAMAYHPGTQALYVPLYVACETTTFNAVEPRPGGPGIGGARRSAYFHPQSPDKLGDFAALDVKTGRVLWRNRTRATMSTAALTTGGGLVIVGGNDRYLYVHDAADGRVLYQTRLPTSPQGFPVTYSVGGRQYLAVPVASESPSSWQNSATMLTPEVKRAPSFNGVLVFAVGDARAGSTQ